MFGSMQRGVSAYARVSLETGIDSASPHKLIVMLFDGAVTAVRSALAHMKAGDIAAKGKAISKAITIIDNGLRVSLDKDAGGDIATNLDSLYGYMSARLLHANVRNDQEALGEVDRLLSDLRETWNAIGDQVHGAAGDAGSKPASLMRA